VTRGAARRLAETLDRRGLGEPARLLADAHRPLAPLLGEMAAAYGPLAGLLGARPIDDLRAVLEDPDGLDDLTRELAGGGATSPRGRRAKPR
jgi:hypothetical protein